MGRRSAGVALALVTLAACSLSGGVTEVGTSSPALRPGTASFGSGSATWHLVALGDSVSAGVHCAGCTTFADRYAENLARRAGVRVDRNNWSIRGFTVGRLLELVRRDAVLRADLADADVVTLTVGVNDMPWNPGADLCQAAGTPGQVDWTKITPECLRAAGARYARLLGELLDELSDRRAGRPTMVRLTGFYDDWVGRTGAAPAELATVARGVRLFDRAERRVAAAHGAVVADLLHVFNGPRGRADAGTYLEPNHGVHPNQRRHDLIARVLLATGLAPLRG